MTKSGEILTAAASLVAVLTFLAVCFRWVVLSLIENKLTPWAQRITEELAGIRASFDAAHVRDTLEQHGQRIAATEARVDGIEARLP